MYVSVVMWYLKDGLARLKVFSSKEEADKCAERIAENRYAFGIDRIQVFHDYKVNKHDWA